MKTLLQITFITLFPFIGNAQVLLHDDFSGGAVNASNWAISEPFSDSSVSVASGVLSMANGGGLLSVSEYVTPIEVAFSFAFTGTTHDSFRVYTRVDEFYPNGYALMHGVGVSFRIQSDGGSTIGNIAIEENGGTLSAGTMALTNDTYYDVRLVDTGSDLTLYLDGSSTPFLTASNSSVYGNLVGAFNREGAGNGSAISAGSISSLEYITVTAIPEPSTYAVILGIVVLLAVSIRRRRVSSGVN